MPLRLPEGRVARSDLVQMEGVVKEVMVGGNFRVEVEGGHQVLAQLAGNMRRNRIRVVLGDQVTVAVSPYDPTRGLIVFRAKERLFSRWGAGRGGARPRRARG